MTKVLFTLLVGSLTGMLASSVALAGGKVAKKDDKTWTVTIDAVPTTYEECKALRDDIGKTPQGGMAYFMVAHLVMIDIPDVGQKCLVIGMDLSHLAQNEKVSKSYKRPSVKGYQLNIQQLQMISSQSFTKDAKYVAKAYVQGTKTENSYALPALPYTYVVREHKIQQTGGFNDMWTNTWHGFVDTRCSDSKSLPFHVKKNNRGLWKIFRYSSFYSGCKDPPAAAVDDDL